MPRLEELFKQIEELDQIEREKLAFELSKGDRPPLAQDSASVVSTPGVCGGAARFIRTRIPVWTVERMRQLGVSDADVLKSYPTLRAEDLVEARSYAARHREEIEQSIRENEKDEELATTDDMGRDIRRIEI